MNILKHVNHILIMLSSVVLENNSEKSSFEYIPNFLSKTEIYSLESWIKTLTFHQGTKKNNTPINRKQIWFQEDGKYFCSQWKDAYPRWTSHDYNEILMLVQNKINKHTKKKTNSCLINLYETGNDFIPPHKDTHLSFGHYPHIFNLSIGTSRTLKISNNETDLKFNLEHNSLFIMSGASQKYYYHEILKDPSIKTPRISLTFREVL
jgi:alkylated DNA repair dioxygenase AlkB